MATRDAMPDGPATGARSFAAPVRKPRGRRRRLRIILGALGGLLVLAVVLLMLAPTLAGWLGRGYVEDAINRTIPGSVQIGGMSLSWRGPQEAGPVVLLDPAGGRVATVTVTSSAGLWGLAMGGRDLGLVAVSGSADIKAGADGTTNLRRALVKARGPAGGSAGGPSGPTRLPATLAGTLSIDTLDVTYTDPRLKVSGKGPGGAVILKGIAGTAAFAPGATLEGTLSAAAFAGPTVADATTAIGSLQARWRITGLTDGQGLVTPGAATVDASAEFKDLSVAFADALAEQGGRLEAMLGPALTLALAAKGTGSDLLADVAASSALVTADLGLRYTPAAVEASRVGTIRVETQGLAVLAPGVFVEMPDAAGGTLVVDEWPRAEVMLESLRVPMSGWSPDLAGVSGKATLRAGEGSGRLAVGGGEEGAARVVAVRLAPLRAMLETGSLAGGVRLTASNSVEVDGRTAGDLTVDLTATNLMRAGAGGGPGALDPAGATLEGVATLSGFDTRAAQPFVQGMGLRLAQDVGPGVDVELTAIGRINPDSSLPETSVELHVKSRNVTAGVELMVDHGVARTAGDGVMVEVGNAGPAVTRLAQKWGVRIQGGMPVRMAAGEVHVDLARLLGRRPAPASTTRAEPRVVAQVGARGMDLRGAGGTVTVTVGPTAGVVPLAVGGPARPFSLAATTVVVESKNIAQGVNLRTKMDAGIDGKPAGTLDVTVAVLGVLDELGVVRSAPVGPVRGRIVGQGVPSSLLQTVIPGLAVARVDLPTDLGPSVDFAVVARPGEGAATEFELRVTGEKLTIGGVLAMDGGVVRSGATPLTVRLRSPGPLLTRWLPAGFEARSGGSAGIMVRDLAVPLRPAPDLFAATGRADLDVRGVGVGPAGEAPVEVESVMLSVEAGATAVVLRESRGELALTPAGVGAILARLAPQLDPRPVLRAPAKMSMTFSGGAVPRGADGVPDLARAGALAWTASIPGRVEVDNLGSFAGTAERVGPVGFEGLSMSGSVPAGALLGGGAGDVTAVLSARMLGGAGDGTRRLDGEFAAHVEGGQPRGPMSARLKVAGLDTRWADAAAGRPGLAEGLLGPGADLDVVFSAEFAAASGGGAAELRNGSVAVSLASPSFSMSAPAMVLIRPDRFELSRPTVVKATVAPEWANRFVLAQQVEVDGPPEPRAASFAAPAEVSLNVVSLVVARGAGPMKPGVFAMRAVMDVPHASMILGDGPADFTDVHADVSGGQKPGVVGFSLTTVEARPDSSQGAAGNGALPEPIRFSGGVFGVCDETGVPTFDEARVSATGRAPGVSTAVIDALARQNGLLLELLGPTVSLDVELGGFGRESGKISASAVSTRARGAIKGTVQGGVLVASEPVKVELTEVTPELGARLVKGLPLVGAFEKKPEDGPAVLTATGLRAPLDHDLTRLDADVLIEFGKARFETGPAFSAILKVVRARDSGEVGRRLEPLKLTVRSGAISYDRYTLPLGEFDVETQGTVDLANGRMDVLTYIPIGALTDEAAGVFNTGLGRLLGGAVPLIEKATMVPWRTRGPMAGPRTTPDLGMFLENTGRTLISPGSDLFKRLEEVLGGGKK